MSEASQIFEDRSLRGQGSIELSLAPAPAGCGTTTAGQSQSNAQAQRGRTAVCFAGLLAAVMLLLPGPTLASGVYYTRVVSSSSLGTCSGAKVQRERLLSGADVHELWQGVAIACMSDRVHADWVVVAAVYCSDDTLPSAAICFDDGRRGVPLLVPDRVVDGIHAPLRIDYSLIKYGAGRDCSIRQEPNKEYDGVTDVGIWSCDAVYYYDGTKLQDGSVATDRRLYRPRRFFTVALSAIKATNDLSVDDLPIPMKISGDDGRPLLDIGRSISNATR